jgi:di/tricarboxylate transporter
MADLSWQAWLTLGVLAGMTGLLVRGKRPELVLMGALALLLTAGVLTPAEAFAGFANPAVIVIGLMFVVAAGVERTSALGFLDGLLRPRSARPGAAVARLMLPNAILSAFTNNTPQVAMFIPRVQAWARESGIPASKMLIPLSTATIVGGWLALIGTSTNLVVDGYLRAAGLEGFGFFELAWVGVPATLVVSLYYATIGHRLLPSRVGAEAARQTRTYQFDLRVAAGAPFAGQSVEAAGLRTLGRAFLAHVRRESAVAEPVLEPVGAGGPLGEPAAGGDGVPGPQPAGRPDGAEMARPETVLLPGDVLSFVGDAEAMDALLRRPGLERTVPVLSGASGKALPPLPLYEAVVSPRSALVGKTLKAVDFRTRYGGVVLAVQRQDAPLDGALGRTPLRAGDLLLVEGRPGLAERLAAHADDFALVAPLDAQRPVSGKAPIALGLLVGVIVAAGTGWLPLETAALLAAVGMVVTGCIRGREARASVDVPVLVVVAAALGIGLAVENTGLAAVAARGVLAAGAQMGPVATLALVYLCTNILTELITHKAAAVLMLPVALAVATQTGAEPKAFAVAVCIGAAASFLTPIGYQTNLMVMGPGGYRYGDYFRSGLPVSLLVMAVTVTVCALVWL